MGAAIVEHHSENTANIATSEAAHKKHIATGSSLSNRTDAALYLNPLPDEGFQSIDCAC